MPWRSSMGPLLRWCSMARYGLTSLILVACGRVADEPTDGAVELDASLDRLEARDVDIDTSSDGDAKPSPVPNDAATPCGPAPIWGAYSCCDAGLCRGQCVSGSCRCGSLAVGCPVDTYCCDGACKSEKECAR